MSVVIVPERNVLHCNTVLLQETLHMPKEPRLVIVTYTVSLKTETKLNAMITQWCSIVDKNAPVLLGKFVSPMAELVATGP